MQNPHHFLNIVSVLLLLHLGSAGPLQASALGPGRITELHGLAFRLVPGTAPAGRPAPPPMRVPLRHGDALLPGQEVMTGSAAEVRLEVTFQDGSLLRMLPKSDLRLPQSERDLEVRAGRVLIQADRMLGGVPVNTPTAALFPEGTTYLVEVQQGGEVVVTVLEGAVRATRPTPGPAQVAVVLPGEVLHIDPQKPVEKPQPESLLSLLAKEPLLMDFIRPLGSLKRIMDLADQQRRGVLAGRNERLRRELYWQRPRPRPVVLPSPFQPREGDDAPPSIQRAP